MGFGKIFGQSIREYKLNIKPILTVIFMFLFLPYIILFGANYLYFSSDTGKNFLTESASIQTQLEKYALSESNLSLADEQISAELSSRQFEILLQQAPYFII